MVNSGLSGGLYIIYMVGGFDHLEKIWKSMGMIIPYMKWKIKMVKTTNQVVMLVPNEGQKYNEPLGTMSNIPNPLS